ncbi:hypothetical protein GUA87_01540 [Sneathiella sp. P13V-1]|uniref:hypothetical protein n=1 Tax=Sneathiella sp. P13V-1 TaxID=2697366 RepID=UPI00187B7854|nr:hypothetical protein [Sneathiella sp. P13V-1]MBE7635511.1 hypothetical protein [Sneathiella sp. P13V-1]
MTGKQNGLETLEGETLKDDSPLILGAAEQATASHKTRVFYVLLLIAVSLVTILWLAAVGFYVDQNVGLSNILQLLPHELGALFAGAFTPIAFLWLLVSYARRSNEAYYKGAALDQLMRELGYPSPEAEARVASLTRTLEEHASAVQVRTEEAARRIEIATAALSQQQDVAENLMDELSSQNSALRDELQSRIAELADLLAKAEGQRETLDNLALTQTEQFEKSLDLAAEKSEKIQSAITQQVEQLQASITDSETASQNLVQELEKSGQAIEGMAKRSEERVQLSNKSMLASLNEMEEARDKTLSELEIGGEKFRSRADQLEKQSRDIIFQIEKATETLRQGGEDSKRTGDEVIGRLSGLRDGLYSAREAVETILTELESKQDRVRQQAVDASNDSMNAIAQLEAEASRLSTLGQELSESLGTSSQKISDEAAMMESSLHQAEDKIKAVENLLDEAQKLIAASGDKALRDSRSLGEQFAGHANRLDQSAELAYGRAQEMQAALRKQLNALEQASNHVNSLTEEIAVKLGENVDNLSQASLETSNQITQLGTGFQRQADIITSTTNKVAGEIREAGEEIRRESESIELYGEKAAKNIKTAAEDLEKQNQQLGNTADVSTAKLKAAAEDAVRQHQDLMASAERATLQARQSGEAASSQSAELARMAEKASGELRAMGDQAREHLDSLAKAANTANEQASSLSETTAGNVERLATASDLANAQFEKLAELSEKAKQSSVDMEQVIGKETAALTEIARQLADRADYIRTSLEDRTRLLHKSAGQANIVGEGFRRKTVELAKASELMLSGLQQADQALMRHRKEIDQTRKRFELDMTRVTEQVGDAGRQATEMGSEAATIFEERASDLLKFTGRAREETEGLLDQFEQQRQRIEVTAKQVENSLQETSSMLSEESRNLREASTSASEEALVTSLKFQQQADRLKTASEVVRRQLEYIESDRREKTGDAMRKASALIMDSMHSMSIDIARSIDNTLPDELWNRYRKGEKSIFTRRLIKNRDEERIQHLYKEQGDFRRYVDQYRAAFEQLLQEAENSEFSDLLAETYASSDLGKVYFMLNDALGSVH